MCGDQGWQLADVNTDQELFEQTPPPSADSGVARGRSEGAHWEFS